ncbi:hypothetical protein OIDMADRAFT_156663 [Oidiodendron maius Zn]|uniref:Xylanolytic transcriptional activator regulatory domain-containing protein n=1 Tax=Oidiodendron maius (strain Zn) TaxID=913774 RepID=A0A0C3CZW5_OIDMZ|nr:hypothetical protein OIDMADRAFT_156663 [Oidiodendron maius Zn]
MGINFSTFKDVIIQDGDTRNVLRTKVFKNTSSNPIQDLKGTLCKTRFYGQSHWMFALKQVHKDGNTMADDASKDVREALEKCKRMARAAKAERPIKWHMNPNFKDYIPRREIADKLVNLYLRTCESVYRILHIPSFKEEYAEYWYDPSSANTTTAVKMLLVMAIGTCFYQDEGNEDLRSMAQQWVYSAQSWTAAPFEKGRLNISGIQINCLLVLARETNAVGGDLIWTASGTLLRTAFSMGFHRDPKHFPKVPLFVAEMRRRISATVFEMAIQTALDAGMPPLITADDFDTEPPANIDDEELTEGMQVMPRSKPVGIYTRTSIQILLIKSQRMRLRIVQILNNFQCGPSYDEVLHLDQEVTQACNDASRVLKAYSRAHPRPTELQRILLDILVRRSLLHIHIPFFVQSKVDPRYYFSRKVCLETALAIFFHSGAEDLPPSHDFRIVDDYTRLKLVGGGIFKDVVLHAATIITLELIFQLEEDVRSGLPPSIQRKASREPLYEAVQDIITLTSDRIREGENNAKGHLFLSAAAAQIHAMTNGIPPEEVIPEAAKQSAAHCLELLRARTKMPPVTPESDLGTNVSSSGESMEEPDYGFNVFMPDVNMEFEIPESWVFTGWEMN